MTLTRGDLDHYGLMDEKSAEAIVVVANELRTDTAEASLSNEGQNEHRKGIGQTVQAGNKRGYPGRKQHHRKPLHKE